MRDPRLVALIRDIAGRGAEVYARPDVRQALGLSAEWPPRGHGLALGSSVSRWLANHVMLDGLDHHVKRELRVPGYLRYLDDLFLFGDHRPSLRAARDGVVSWLDEARGPRVKDPAAPLLPCRGLLHALGHEISRRGAQVLPRARRRLRVRVRSLARGGDRGWRKATRRSMASSAGVLMFGA